MFVFRFRGSVMGLMTVTYPQLEFLASLYNSGLCLTVRSKNVSLLEPVLAILLSHSFGDHKKKNWPINCS